VQAFGVQRSKRRRRGQRSRLTRTAGEAGEGDEPALDGVPPAPAELMLDAVGDSSDGDSGARPTLMLRLLMPPSRGMRFSTC
jgi:hypothetical protein